MIVRYRTIEHERTEDAPFMGALISAINCKFSCKNCFNKEFMKTSTILEKDSDSILREISNNIFNKGVIFGGLEWTLQCSELLELSQKAPKYGLKTMLYTGNTFDELKCVLGGNINVFDYIKCGKYECDLSGDNVQYGVSLASTNQKIYKRGVDYDVSN